MRYIYTDWNFLIHTIWFNPHPHDHVNLNWILIIHTICDYALYIYSFKLPHTSLSFMLTYIHSILIIILLLYPLLFIQCAYQYIETSPSSSYYIPHYLCRLLYLLKLYILNSYFKLTDTNPIRKKVSSIAGS